MVEYLENLLAFFRLQEETDDDYEDYVRSKSYFEQNLLALFELQQLEQNVQNESAHTKIHSPIEFIQQESRCVPPYYINQHSHVTKLRREKSALNKIVYRKHEFRTKQAEVPIDQNNLLGSSMHDFLNLLMENTYKYTLTDMIPPITENNETNTIINLAANVNERSISSKELAPQAINSTEIEQNHYEVAIDEEPKKKNDIPQQKKNYKNKVSKLDKPRKKVYKKNIYSKIVELIM